MSRMERIFTLISRFNSLMSLIIVFGLGCVLILVFWNSSIWKDRSAVEVHGTHQDAKANVVMRFGHVESIMGADTKMITLMARDSSASKLYSGTGGYAGENRNMLFLVGKDSKAHWLFPNQQNVILVSEQLALVNNENKKSATKALYFEYVDTDSNSDGHLASDDLSNVGLAKPDGSDFKAVLKGLNRILSFQVTDDGFVSIIYQSTVKVRQAKFSLINFDKQSDQELAEIPVH